VEIKELRTQLEGVKSQATALLNDPSHKEGMRAEKKAELDTLLTKAGELRDQIDGMVDLEEKRADLANLDKYLNEPVHTVPPGGRGERRRRCEEGPPGCRLGNLGSARIAPTSIAIRTDSGIAIRTDSGFTDCSAHLTDRSGARRSLSPVLDASGPWPPSSRLSSTAPSRLSARCACTLHASNRAP
jgi:hypothetical protein